MRLLIVVFATLLATVASAAEPTLRAYPSGPVQAFPLDSVRGVQSLLLHNLAVVNTTNAPFTVEAVDFELLREGQVIERRTVAGPDLARAAAGGSAIQKGGMIAAVGFQFGDVLGKPEATLAPTPTLAPGEALLIASQVFSFSGQRDALRITLRGGPGAVLTLPVTTAQPPARYRFPLEGRFYIQASASLNTHHRWAVPEEFALDIGQIGTDGRSYRTGGGRFSDYFVYGLPVLAAADGEVVRVIDGQIEDPGLIRRSGETQTAYFQRLLASQDALMAKGPDALAGNSVVVRHPWGEYSVYAHLRPGSIKVKVGDVVTVGQPLGEVGSSGSSTEPHLHFHICDGPSALVCAGRAMSFTNVENPMALLPGPIQSGDLIETR